MVGLPSPPPTVCIKPGLLVVSGTKNKAITGDVRMGKVAEIRRVGGSRKMAGRSRMQHRSATSKIEMAGKEGRGR